MKILALELSSALGSIAFVGDASEEFHTEFANDRKNSGEFFGQLKGCVSQCGQPDRLVVGLGPGSYAGTRIALAAAAGLRAVNSAELVGLPSVCALRTDVSEYIAIGDARRHSFHFTHVANGDCVTGPMLCSEEEVNARLSATSLPVFASELLPLFPQARLAFPSASILAALGAAVVQISRETLEPIYLRDPYITQPKRSITVAVAEQQP